MFLNRFVPAGFLVSIALQAFASERPHEARAIRPGVSFSLVSKQPDLVTPTGIDVDREGNIWVVASHTHFPPKDYQGPKQDEILVFSPNGTRTVFYNKTDRTMDLELGDDGWVYLAERDRILRIRDTDDDGRADEEEDIATLESEAVYPHNGLSGLAWSPNGDLYFCLGENFSQPWVLTGTDGRTAMGTGEGGVFSCDPDGGGLTRVARGFWNPFGFCVREDGEMFAAENDPGERPPCRVLHIVEGGDYGFQRIYGQGAHHPFVGWNGELRGTLPMVHPSGEAPCGVVPLGGGPLIPSWGDHRIDFFSLSPDGASYSAKQVEIVKGGRYFRPTCIVHDEYRSTSGTKIFYLTDWVDGSYNVHGYGRIWRLEINLNVAPWAQPRNPEGPTKAAKLARKLRTGKGIFTRGTLLAHARSEDAFVARAALVRLARQAGKWKPETIVDWPDADRVSAVLALRIADAAPDGWVEPLFDDRSGDVQFETLRWIADRRHNQYLQAVEQLLGRSDLSFELFEAGVAAWNTLNGKPELGLNNTEMLLARVKDEASSPKLRAYALRLLPTIARRAAAKGPVASVSFPKGVTAAFLEELISVGDEALTMEAVRVLSGHPAAGKAALARVAGNRSISDQVRAEAVAGLAAVADSHLPLLVGLTTDPHASVRKEALRALRGQTLSDMQMAALKELPSSDLLAAVLEPGTMAAGRPDPGDLDAWLKRLESLPGEADIASGRRVFHHANVALCSRCHRHGGRGKIVGPDLSSVANRGDRSWLLNSILQPSAEMAPEYQPRDLVLTDGSIHTGIRLRSYSKEQIRDSNGNTLTFGKDVVAEIRDLDRSFMPDGLVYSMTDRELRDLLAFLESR